MRYEKFRASSEHLLAWSFFKCTGFGVFSVPRLCIKQSVLQFHRGAVIVRDGFFPSSLNCLRCMKVLKVQC